MSNTYRGSAMVGYILSKKIIGSCKTTTWYFIYKTKYENATQFLDFLVNQEYNQSVMPFL